MKNAFFISSCPYWWVFYWDTIFATSNHPGSDKFPFHRSTPGGSHVG